MSGWDQEIAYLKYKIGNESIEYTAWEIIGTPSSLPGLDQFKTWGNAKEGQSATTVAYALVTSNILIDISLLNNQTYINITCYVMFF